MQLIIIVLLAIGIVAVIGQVHITLIIMNHQLGRIPQKVNPTDLDTVYF